MAPVFPSAPLPVLRAVRIRPAPGAPFVPSRILAGGMFAPIRPAPGVSAQLIPRWGVSPHRRALRQTSDRKREKDPRSSPGIVRYSV